MKRKQVDQETSEKRLKQEKSPDRNALTESTSALQVSSSTSDAGAQSSLTPELEARDLNNSGRETWQNWSLTLSGLLKQNENEDEEKEEKEQKEKPKSDGKESFLRFGVATAAGQATGITEKQNQDRSFTEYGVNGDVRLDLFGVFDGHGEKGHDVSEYVSKQITNFISQEIEQLEKETVEKLESDESTVKGLLTTAIKKLSTDLKTKNINKILDSSKSGTTAVFGLRVGRKVFICNIGDSRCIWAKKLHQGKNDDSAQLEAIQVTIDHKPGNPDEKKRIINAGGRVGVTGPGKPFRVFEGSGTRNYPGLAVSRSIGDAWTQHLGVISQPDITVRNFGEHDVFAVFGSDGLFEFFPKENLVSTAWKYREDLNDAAKNLVTGSRQRWLRQTKGSYVDDITCVIVWFDQQHPSFTAAT